MKCCDWQCGQLYPNKMNTGGIMTEKNANNSAKTGKAKSQTFAVGDLAVYPAHGVGEIQSIESRVVNGEEHKFYIMKVIENGMEKLIETNWISRS